MAQSPSQRYAVEPKGAGTFVVKTETAGDWEMQMRFAVFHSPKDPKMEMRGGAAGVRYNVVSWFNDALDKNSDTVQKIEDSASVGDGFDPKIVGSIPFRKTRASHSARNCRCLMPVHRLSCATN
jgi:hypothetical protein